MAERWRASNGDNCRLLQRQFTDSPDFLTNEEIGKVFYFMVNYASTVNAEAVLYLQITKLIHQNGRLPAIPFQKLLDSENITALFVISEIAEYIDPEIHENLVLKAKSILFKYKPEANQYKYSLNILRKLDSKIVMNQFKEEFMGSY